jgi:hypothetical protein
MAIAATGQTRATPRIKLLSHGFAIDHPDPQHGEQLMADALRVADRDAMHGILRQSVKASVNGQKPAAVNLLLHDFNGEEHQAQGFRRSHAGGANGVRKNFCPILPWNWMRHRQQKAAA